MWFAKEESKQRLIWLQAPNLWISETLIRKVWQMACFQYQRLLISKSQDNFIFIINTLTRVFHHWNSVLWIFRVPIMNLILVIKIRSIQKCPSVISIRPIPSNDSEYRIEKQNRNTLALN